MPKKTPRDDRDSEKIVAQSLSDKKKLSPQKKRKLSAIERLGERLNLPRSTIYEYARQGKIPCVKIGGRYVIPPDAEQRILELAYRNWPPPPEAKPLRGKKGQPADQTTSETTTVPSDAGNKPSAAKGENQPS
jgi:excisionase family DNA binding protein